MVWSNRHPEVFVNHLAEDGTLLDAVEADDSGGVADGFAVEHKLDVGELQRGLGNGEDGIALRVRAEGDFPRAFAMAEMFQAQKRAGIQRHDDDERNGNGLWCDGGIHVRADGSTGGQGSQGASGEAEVSAHRNGGHPLPAVRAGASSPAAGSVPASTARPMGGRKLRGHVFLHPPGRPA